MSLNTNVSEAESQGIASETKHGGGYPGYNKLTEIRQFTVNRTVRPLPNSLHRPM